MPNTGLKRKFYLAITTLLIVVGIAALFAFKLSANIIIDEVALRFATKQAMLDRNKITSLIDREVALARKMADDPILQKWARDEKNPGLKRKAFETLESYRKIFRDKSFFIALSDSAHYYIYNNKDNRIDLSSITPDNPADNWFYEALRTVDDFEINLDYNQTLGESRVWINAIMKGKNGEKTGICGCGINLTYFLNEIVFSQEQGLSTILTDASGVIQAYRVRSIVEQNATSRSESGKITIFNQIDNPDEREILKLAMSDLSKGTREVASFQVQVAGKKYLAAVSYMKSIGWFNLVLLEPERAIGASSFIPIAAIMIIALFLAIALLSLLMNRMVLTPLSELTRASSEVAGGNYNISIAMPGKDELAELASSFNRMTSTVREHTNNLESMVKERTRELAEANSMLETSQQRITESIRYAGIIQNSMLPDQDNCLANLSDYFIICTPKEIVGGDFYYLKSFPDHFIVAVIDCTGHGVPGSLMTMAVHAVLNNVIENVCNSDPSKILTELNTAMRSNLSFKGIDAGLDIALCMVDRKNCRVVFAGAGLSLYIAKSGEILEIRGDSQRIGYKNSHLSFVYENHLVSVEKGDLCYLATDGVFDLPGGEKGHGFGRERFRAMLGSLLNQNITEQGKIIDRNLSEYQGGWPQRDDMTIIGFRI